MNKPKHTPGPWTAVYRPSMNLPGVHVRKTQNQLEIGYCNSSECEAPESDARLIATAPELLEMLISLHNSCELSAGADIDVLKLINKATGIKL